MTRDDYLNPESIRSQCSQAVSRMEEDNRALKMIKEGIQEFVGDDEIKSESFSDLKQQLNNYQIIIEAMRTANTADIGDFKNLGGLVGSEILDGAVIYCQMENALNLKEVYLFNEGVYRGSMAAAGEPELSEYYRWKAEKYRSLAENSQGLYEKWREKAERFDEISMSTCNLFSESESISPLIQKGFSEVSGAFRNGAYVLDKKSEWKKQIKNRCLRLGMCFEDMGGDQAGPYRLWQRGLDSDKEYIRNLVHGYEEYEDYSDEEIGKLLKKLDSEGCGYVAFANIIADEYRGKEAEFESKFGFPLFLQNAVGTAYVNYNQLIMDLYCASDNRRKDGSYDAGEDISATSGTGTTPESREYRFERYMAENGADVEINNIECSTEDVFEKCKEEAGKGNRMIISTCPVRLEDAEGEPAHMDGGHAMMVTGLEDDGRIEVSSWGSKYYITPEDPDYTAPEKNRAGEAYIKLQSVSFHQGE